MRMLSPFNYGLIPCSYKLIIAHKHYVSIMKAAILQQKYLYLSSKKPKQQLAKIHIIVNVHCVILKWFMTLRRKTSPSPRYRQTAAGFNVFDYGFCTAPSAMAFNRGHGGA